MNHRRAAVSHLVMSLSPATRLFRLKRGLLRWSGATVGEGVRIVSSARFYVGGELTIGGGTWIGHDVLIAGGDADVVIGARVDIGPRVSILTGSHEILIGEDRAAGPGYSRDIRIANGVWIGAGCTILGGVSIGECSVIGAGSVVTMDVPARCLVGGSPARRIRNLGP